MLFSSGVNPRLFQLREKNTELIMIVKLFRFRPKRAYGMVIQCLSVCLTVWRNFAATSGSLVVCDLRHFQTSLI
jgi:hypothetical protein